MSQPPYCFTDNTYVLTDSKLSPKTTFNCQVPSLGTMVASPQPSCLFSQNLQELSLILTTVKFTENQQVFQELLRIEQWTNNDHIKLDYYNRNLLNSSKICRAVAQLNVFLTYLFCNFLLKQKKIIYIC